MSLIACPAYTVTWTLHAAGTTFALPVKSWTITRHRKDPLSWSADLVMTAALKRGGTIGQHLKPKSYNAVWALQKYLTCTITLGSGVDMETWTSPKLVLKTRRFRATKKEKLLSLSGMDRFGPLLEKDVVETDVRSVEASLVMAHAVINESCAARGITSVSIGFTDFPIKTFHRTGQPMSYLREIWDVYQCDTQWVGDTLVISPGGSDPATDGADYALTDGLDATAIEYQESDDDTINEATIERPRELKRATAEPIVGKALGPVSISLATPMTYVTARIKLFSPGYDAEWVWDDAGGTPLTSSPLRTYMGTTPAATLRFNIYPPVGSSSLDTIPYSVELVGEESHSSLGGYESAVSYTARDTAAQGMIGVHKPDAPITMQHIPNQTICQAAAEAYVVEELLNYETAQVEAVMKQFVDPGQCCGFTSVDLELSAHNMRTQTVTYKGDAKGLTFSVGLGRGPA